MSSLLYHRAVTHLQAYPERPQLGLKQMYKAATLGTSISFLASLSNEDERLHVKSWSAVALSALGNFYLEGRYGLSMDRVQGCMLLEDARALGSNAAAIQLALLSITPQQ